MSSQDIYSPSKPLLEKDPDGPKAFIETGEMRYPRKGEYFLINCIEGVVLAPCDLEHHHFIVVPV